MRVIKNILVYGVFFINTLLIYSQTKEYSEIEYSKKCMEVINKARKELHLKLPQLIENNLRIIKKDIEDKIANKVNLLSEKEIIEEYEEVNYGTFLSLLDNEQKANKIYFEALNDLGNINSDFLNFYYKNNKNLKFKDFYSLPKIRLAEEVVEYLEGVLKEEKERISRKNKEMGVSLGLSIIELIPGATAVTKILEGVKHGAKLVRTGKKLAENKTFVAKLTTKLIKNKEKALVILRRVSNAEKRAKISARIAYVGGAATATNMTLAYILKSEATLDEKINEFSKGMTAVYLQNLRDYIKLNKQIISENEI